MLFSFRKNGCNIWESIVIWAWRGKFRYPINGDSKRLTRWAADPFYLHQGPIRNIFSWMRCKIKLSSIPIASKMIYKKKNILTKQFTHLQIDVWPTSWSTLPHAYVSIVKIIFQRNIGKRVYFSSFITKYARHVFL